LGIETNPYLNDLFSQNEQTKNGLKNQLTINFMFGSIYLLEKKKYIFLSDKNIKWIKKLKNFLNMGEYEKIYDYCYCIIIFIELFYRISISFSCNFCIFCALSTVSVP
jgi:hypothetical protein